MKLRFDQFGRFVLIGGFATGLYVVVTTIASSPIFGFSNWLASLMGFLISLIASYVGHAYFTFKVGHGHRRHGARFLVVTICLATSLSWLSNTLVNHYGLDKLFVACFVGGTYPFASFMLHSLWSFAPARREQHEA
jgi:putative flippase GtrA